MTSRYAFCGACEQYRRIDHTKHRFRRLRAPGGRSTTAAVAPDRSAAGLERPLGSLRGGQSGRGDLTE